MTLVEMLKEKTGRDFEVITTTKNNGLKLEGVRVIDPTVNILPIMYRPNNFTDEQFVDYVAENYSRFERDKIDIDNILTKDYILNNVFPALINTEMNEEILSDLVHKDFKDLSIIYKVDVPEASGMITLKFTMLDYLNLTEEEVHNAAIENTKPKLSDMADIIPGSPRGLMYLLSNVQCLYGAGTILNKAALNTLYEHIGSFYIIPSSVHEVICIPKFSDDTEALKEMVMEINRAELGIEERLSDNVYEYNGEEVELIEVA